MKIKVLERVADWWLGGTVETRAEAKAEVRRVKAEEARLKSLSADQLDNEREVVLAKAAVYGPHLWWRRDYDWDQLADEDLNSLAALNEEIGRRKWHRDVQEMLEQRGPYYPFKSKTDWLVNMPCRGRV